MYRHLQTIQRKLTEKGANLRLLDVPVVVNKQQVYLEFFDGEDPGIVALKYARILGLEVSACLPVCLPACVPVPARVLADVLANVPAWGVCVGCISLPMWPCTVVAPISAARMHCFVLVLAVCVVPVES